VALDKALGYNSAMFQAYSEQISMTKSNVCPPMEVLLQLEYLHGPPIDEPGPAEDTHLCIPYPSAYGPARPC
jgi:hypothetical protein